MFRLLCQHPPFYSEVFGYDAIRGGLFYESPQWNSLSNDVKDLIRNMLNPDPNLRFSVNEVLLHPWLSQGQQQVNSV